MTRDRIVGQCNAADFVFVNHLVNTHTNSDDPIFTTLKHKQKLAILFAGEACQKGVGWGLVCKVVTEVLFWGDDDKIHNVEIKLTHDPAKLKQVKEFKNLW